MRKMLCFALLLPLVAMAAISPELLKVQNVLSTGEGNNGPAKATSLPPAMPSAFVVGRVDTIGGTTYDIQYNGPQSQVIYLDPNHGIHCIWMYSAQTSSPFSDRNMRYNYYDLSSNSWGWIDGTNFMNSGIGVFSIRSGFGTLDVDTGGKAWISCHQIPSSTINPDLAQDAAPGAGIWTECTGARLSAATSGRSSA